MTRSLTNHIDQAPPASLAPSVSLGPVAYLEIRQGDGHTPDGHTQWLIGGVGWGSIRNIELISCHVLQIHRQ